MFSKGESPLEANLARNVLTVGTSWRRTYFSETGKTFPLHLHFKSQKRQQSVFQQKKSLSQYFPAFFSQSLNVSPEWDQVSHQQQQQAQSKYDLQYIRFESTLVV